MRKTVYLLGLTLLCGLPAQAQEALVVADSAVWSEDTVQSDDLIDNTFSEQTAPSETVSAEGQTIFFSDEQPDEPDWGAAPVIPETPKVPVVQMPEEVKSPEIKQPVSPSTQNDEEEKAEAPLRNDDKTNNIVIQEEDEQEMVEFPIPQPQPEIGSPENPENTSSQSENIVEEKEVIEAPQTQAEEIAPMVSEEISSSQSEDAEAPKAEEQPEPSIEEETAQENNDTPVTVPEPQKEQQPELKKNSFSLDENALLQSQTNAYSLDANAGLSDNFLKNDALSPSVLNRSIINISPEQRAKMMMKKKYDEMDTNQDGVVSENEFVEYKTKEARKIAHQVFKQIDRNNNKTLSQYEYGLLMDKMIENYIKPKTSK